MITVLDLDKKTIVDLLVEKENIYYWGYPFCVEDLCFYKNDKCVFSMVAHEDMFLFFTSNKNDIELLKELGLDITIQTIKDSECISL